MKPSTPHAGIAKGGLGERLDLPRDPWFLARVDAVTTDGPQFIYALVEVTPTLDDYGYEDKSGGLTVDDAYEFNNTEVSTDVVILARFRAWADDGTPTYEFEAGGGGSFVPNKRVEIVRADADGSPVAAFVQDPNGSGGLVDVGSSITVKKFTAPAREDFEEDGYYLAIFDGETWWAETGPLTECVTVTSTVTCVDGSIVVTPVTIRVVDRACP